MGDEDGGRRGGITRDLQKLKQQAMAYYQENDVPRKLEDLLNSTFYLQPADVYGHLVGTRGELPPPSGPRCGSAMRLRLRNGVAPARCWAEGLGDAQLRAGRACCAGRMRRVDKRTLNGSVAQVCSETGELLYYPRSSPAVGFLNHRPDAELTLPAGGDANWTAKRMPGTWLQPTPGPIPLASTPPRCLRFQV